MDYGLLGQGRTKWRNCRLTHKTPYEFDLKTRIRFLKWFDFIVGTPKCMVKKRCVSVSGKEARKYTLIFNPALMRSEQKKISNCTQLGNFSHALAFALLTHCCKVKLFSIKTVQKSWSTWKVNSFVIITHQLKLLKLSYRKKVYFSSYFINEKVGNRRN